MNIYTKIDLKDFLFTKHILVNDYDTAEDSIPETLMSLARIFNIRITEGKELAHRDMIRFVSKHIGENVPEPFYRGFPKSVIDLTPEQYFLDQILNYYITYDLGDMSVPRHSVLETDEDYKRLAFKEAGSIKDFRIVGKAEAGTIIKSLVDDMMKSTRPLSQGQFDAVCTYITENNYYPERVASKNTAILLLIATGDIRFAEYLALSDVMKLTEELNLRVYLKQDVRKLNLKNCHRKLIADVIHFTVGHGRADVNNCFERKSKWAGLLHHIHFKAQSASEQRFVNLMRGKGNRSAYSEFEKEMSKKIIRNAVDSLRSSKGSAAVLRKLNYILSRCNTRDNIEYVLQSVDTNNIIVLMQIYISYLQYEFTRTPRSFAYMKYNMVKTHTETPEEVSRRKSLLTRDKVDLARSVIEQKLRANLSGRLGKVYIDPDMVNYAMPLQIGTGGTGLGVLPKGSRIHIDDAHKIRGFTYWERVDDIDLSVIGLTEDGRQMEFSWRTMRELNSDAIVYSGDETSGYNGGSEYYDVKPEQFKKLYPGIRYLVFCDNVYSYKTFSSCYCKAGFMLRDIDDSGQVFEPKTVQSSFTVDCNSTFCYLFAIDLESNDFVWINTMRDSDAHVAGDTRLDFLIKCINVTSVFNLKTFFTMTAAEVVSDISQADVIVTDKCVEAGEGAVVIREYDVEKILAII